ncbi:MAG: orotate phosphoribosyltransferase [Clostridia bacterium]|nr:orotate phosphoribosyltransferase [Clostridia bacterium]
MLNNAEAEKLLKENSVLLNGHFLLTSGRHSDTYLQCARVFQDPKLSEIFCKSLAEKFDDEKIDIVIGPAIGAILMSYEMSRILGVKNIFAERDTNSEMTLRRGFELKPGQKVLVVEDVVTTGGSVKEVLKLVENCGAEIVGVGSIVDRTGGEKVFDCRFESVYSAKVKSYEKDNCPLCKEGNLPPIKPGSRKI